jgi:hypothetical protein
LKFRQLKPDGANGEKPVIVNPCRRRDNLFLG